MYGEFDCASILKCNFLPLLKYVFTWLNAAP